MAEVSDTAHGLPLQGVVLCSTSVTPELRNKLADHAVEMGAVHKLDLIGDVTHLLVGDVRTPKYRYVAKSRPDIKVLKPEWIEEVRSQWLEGGEVALADLEEQNRLPALFGLHLCLTGFTSIDTRNDLEENIRKHGADYSGDLSKQITHLIVATPQGAKYTFAKQWGVPCVSLKWLTDSLARGMALDEALYDPLMPEEEQGKGAFKQEVKPITGKRGRGSSQAAEEGGKRKFRRTASTRLEEHSQDLWQDISAMGGAKNEAARDQWKEDLAQPSKATSPAPVAAAVIAHSKLFTNWRMCLQGFDRKRATKLKDILTEQCGAEVVESASQLRLGTAEAHCIIIPHLPPQSLYYLSKPINQTIVATEWWVERCIHAKRAIDVNTDALSKPFWTADLPDLSGTNISSTGLNSLDLRQMALIVKTAGAVYQETFTADTSVLISGSMVVKKEKAFYAKKHKIPIVSPEWLWSSIRLGCRQSYRSYTIKTNVTESSPAIDRPPSKTTTKSPLRPRARAARPFIHEDDDTDEAASVQRPSMPLQEVSPNLPSPQKASGDQASGEVRFKSVQPQTERFRTPDELNADIASLSRQLQESRSGKANDTTTTKRKKRTLGRAASAISNRSYSADQAVDDRHDFFDEPRQLEQTAAEPSTQLGYEVPEAEAHREQMARRMGTTFTDETAGKKLASIGTVRDTEVQTRSRRQKAGR